MRYLFGDWERVSLKIQKSPQVFLFFDYDGTLTPIVSRPGLAKLLCTVKDLIKGLQKNPKFTVAIISGRSLKDIKRIVGLKGVIYAGNHGLEIEGRGIRFLRPSIVDSIRPIIGKIASSLRRELRRINGAKVEDKGATLSVHYRLAKARAKALVKKRFNIIVAPYVYSKKVKVYSGKEVLEVRPNIYWNKGSAVTWLLKKKKDPYSLYIGDDVTDIDAFRAIKTKGISIFVGTPKTGIPADYFLKNPRDVERFIKRLLILQQDQRVRH